MTNAFLSTGTVVSRRSPTEFAAAEAMVDLSPEPCVPPVGNPSADDLAKKTLSPMARMPRRRHLTSDDSKAKSSVTARADVPTESSEPSSTRAAGQIAAAIHPRSVEPRVEPSSEDATTVMVVLPIGALSARSSEPNSRVRKTKVDVSPIAPLPSETREPSSSGDTACNHVSPIGHVPKPLEPVSAAADGQRSIAARCPHADAAAEPSSRSAAGHQCGDTQSPGADPLREPSSDDDAATGRLSSWLEVPASSDPLVTDTATTSNVPPMVRLSAALGHTINAIRELDRQRDDLLRAEGNMTRQVKAICRRAVDLRFEDAGKIRAAKMKQADDLYDALNKHGELDQAVTMKVGSTLPLLDARKAIGTSCAKVTLALVKEVKKLPVYKSFVEQVNGFGALGLGQIIGKCGDLNLYANPAKVWKRMGLGLVSGERQRKCVDAAKAVLHGYSPRRRSTMYVIGDSLIKKQSPYRELYLRRKEFETAKATAAGITVRASTDAKAASGEKVMSLMHVHRRGQRYVEKRLLRDLWRAWTGRGVDYTETTS